MSEEGRVRGSGARVQPPRHWQGSTCPVQRQTHGFPFWILYPVILGQITIPLVTFEAFSFEPKLNSSRRFPSQSLKLALIYPQFSASFFFSSAWFCSLQLQDAGVILLAAKSGPLITTKGTGFQQGLPWPWDGCVVRLLIAASDVCHKCLAMKIFQSWTLFLSLTQI